MPYKRKRKIDSAIFLFSILSLMIACNHQIYEAPIVKGAKAKGGVYHSFWNKDNLWLVAETYDLTVKDLVKANKLETPFDIGRGEKIFIPGALRRRFVKFKDPLWNIMRNSLIWPVEGKLYRDWGDDSYHEKLEGIDISAPEGSIVRAATDGWVVYEGDDFLPYGKMIIIQHRYVLATVYGCNSENLVTTGMRVNEGEPIARVGKCNNGEAPYLHFEVVYYAERVNPHKALILPYSDLLELLEIEQEKKQNPAGKK